MSQQVSHLGFLLPVSHVCLQIAFPVSHIGFTISFNFYNFDSSDIVFGINQHTLFPIDFNGTLEIFLKHLKKKNCACVCDWTLIIFQEAYALLQHMSTLGFKNFFFLVYFNTNNFKFFSCHMHPHLSAMLNF